MRVEFYGCYTGKALTEKCMLIKTTLGMIALNFLANPENAALATRENEITQRFPVLHDNYFKFISSLRRVVVSPFP